MAIAKYRPRREREPSEPGIDPEPHDKHQRQREREERAAKRQRGEEQEQPAAPPQPFVLAGDYEAAPGDDPGEKRHKKVRPPRRTGPRVQGDLVGKQGIQGQHIGDRYVRVCRVQTPDFQRSSPGHLIATEDANEARGPVGKVFGVAKRTLIGVPLSTSQAAHERLTNTKALAVLSSDALSSVAYATEEILRVLVSTVLVAGVAALSYSLSIGAAIVVLLVIVGTSYRQTIKAYPRGGGSYIVAKDNLGETPALTAAAALLIDYTLTVAVSISAGVAALISAVPALNGHKVALGVFFILLTTTLNLRGIRESGSIFAVPTYMFIFGMFVMIGIGLFRNASEGFPVTPPPAAGLAEVAGASTLTIFLIMRAFSSGCAALTGVEAISDGVPAFKPPEWTNARKTLTAMIVILAITFSGITFLAHQYGAYPMEPHDPTYQTIVSQIARAVFGGTNAAYYYIQFATLGILILAANTAYSDFPRLAYFLARDRYLPKQYMFRGDRLAYSIGISTLALLAVLVLVGFGGETDRLIPLYAVGVFTSFTLSQSGMVVRWLRLKEQGWRVGLPLNLLGAIATGIVALIVAGTKFRSGAWIVILLIPVLIMMFKAIHRHYGRAANELATQTPVNVDEIEHTVIVPVSSTNRVAKQTLAYARSISPNVTAVYITDDEAEIETMRDDWNKLDVDVPLVIIESPYRSLVGPLLSYLDEIDRQRPNDTLTVVLPEFIARHWWEQILHNQTALRIKAALLFRPGTVVTSVPYHLERRNPKQISPPRPAEIVQGADAG
ncbi:MAG: APC family permease [Thermomicrobiales bacterium]